MQHAVQCVPQLDQDAARTDQQRDQSDRPGNRPNRGSKPTRSSVPGSVPPGPIRPAICAVNWFRTSSAPKTAPAIAVATISSGASAKIE
jgi:hypothetical protein